jgi:tetratricopeptide (TPR) repeat protein
MPGSVRGGHLDEATLLRLVVSDLPVSERRLAERHLWICRECRAEFEASERLDRTFRSAGDGLAGAAGHSGALRAADPFAKRPASKDRNAAALGLDALALARQTMEALSEARNRARRIVEDLKSGDSGRAALSDLDLASFCDRLALGFGLDRLLGGVEESPSLRRGEARAVLRLLNLKANDQVANETTVAGSEYTVPLADLRGRALLLSGAAALWSGDLEEARGNLLSAWSSLGEGRASEPLLARVETFEALRWIADGRPAEAAALADRAAEAISISGDEVDGPRALLAAGLAARGVGRHRDAVTLLRKSALGFGRAAAWSAYVTAASAAALCLLADGRVEESRRAFRDLRRRKARHAPLEDRMYVRETERIALLSAGVSSKGKKSKAAFSAADAVLLRGASVLGERLAAAARESDEKLEVVLADLHGHRAYGFALLYACQKGSALVAQDPLRALGLARRVFGEAKLLIGASTDEPRATLALRTTVQAEAKLLESQAQVQLGYALESRMAAVEARELFRAVADVGFGMALADYYEGQAAGFARDYVAGERLLKKALKVFAELGQDSQVGRAWAALGTLIMQQGDDSRALLFFEHALEDLESDHDGKQLASTLNNRALTLIRLRRFDEARVSSARALILARRLGAHATIQNIRNALAELEFQRRRYDRALIAFSELARVARTAGWEMEQLFAELYVAECLGRLSRCQEMAEVITRIRVALRTSRFAPSPAIEELFACLDKGMLDADVVANVRSYLEQEATGIQRDRRDLRIVG